MEENDINEAENFESEEDFVVLNQYLVDNDDFLYSDNYMKFLRIIKGKDKEDTSVDDYILDQEKLRFIIQGLVKYQDPLFGDIDFEELQDISEGDIPCFSKAIIFTGEGGCGKHTAEIAAIYELKDTIESRINLYNNHLSEGKDEICLDDVLRYYRFSLETIEDYPNKEKKQYLHNIFNELIQMTSSKWAKDLYVIASFGDVTSVLKNKKTAHYFLKNITELMKQDSVNFYFTCIFEGKTSKLKEKYRKPFLVYEMLKPDFSARQLFFENLKINHKQIYIGYKDVQMAEKTEGFTISMLVQLRKMFLLYMKGLIFARYENGASTSSYKEYIKNKAAKDEVEELLIIPPDIIDGYINMIKGSRYEMKNKRENYFANYQTDISSNVNHQQNVGNPNNNMDNTLNTNNTVDSEKNEFNKKIEQASSFSELLNLQASLTPAMPVVYGLSENQEKENNNKIANEIRNGMIEKEKKIDKMEINQDSSEY